MPNLKSKIAIILAGAIDVDLSRYITNDHYIIAVDGGYEHLLQQQIECDILIGDMDSITSENYNGPQICYDPVKDDTDFVCSIKHAKSYNSQAQIAVFGFGSINRIDHVLANLSAITSEMIFISNNQQITVLDRNTSIVADQYQYYSFFALTPVNEFSLSGFKYPLVNYQLNPFDPLCVSNELSSTEANIEISNGRVLCIKSKSN